MNYWIQRSARSPVSPYLILAKLEEHIPELMKGGLFFQRKKLSLDTREGWDGYKNLRQKGDFSYKTTIVLPDELKSELTEVLLGKVERLEDPTDGLERKNRWKGVKFIPLPEITEDGVYNGMKISEEGMKRILPYVAIYHGLATNSGKLESLYRGAEFNKLVDPETQLPRSSKL